MNAVASIYGPLPHSVSAEQSVLGGMLLDTARIYEVVAAMRADEFFIPAHKTIFTAIAEMALSRQHEEIDVVTITEHLTSKGKGVINSVGGIKYLAELAQNVPGSANLHLYMGIVKERAAARGLIEHGKDLINAAGANMPVSDVLEQAQAGVLQLTGHAKRQGALEVKTVIGTVMQNLSDRIDGVAGGVMTHFQGIDDRLHGLQGGDMIIVAGRPSMGKTALAVQAAFNDAIYGEGRPLIFSMEMPAAQLVERGLSQYSGVKFESLRQGDLTDEDFDRIAATLSRFANMQLLIDESGGLTASDIVMRSRMAKQRHGDLSMIVVDYLQLISGAPGEMTKDVVSGASRSLKALAKELNVPVIALSQLNRGVEQRPNKRPVMSDLRESGAIEQDADIVAMMYRDEYYNPDSEYKGLAEFIIRKHRNGPVGTVPLLFEGEYVRFSDYLGNYAGGHE